MHSQAEIEASVRDRITTVVKECEKPIYMLARRLTYR
jgi:hypothetical protein